MSLSAPDPVVPDLSWDALLPLLWKPLLNDEAQSAITNGIALQYVLPLYPDEYGKAALNNKLLHQLAAVSRFNSYADTQVFLNNSAWMWRKLDLRRSDLYRVFKSAKRWRTIREHSTDTVADVLGVERQDVFTGTYKDFSSTMRALAHGLTAKPEALPAEQVKQLAVLGNFWYARVGTRGTSRFDV